jgi:integrase/recombinase XerC
MAYMRDVGEFIYFSDKQELTANLIEDFINHLRHKRLKATTIRRKCMSIRCLCKHLISLGNLDHNILSMIDSIRVHRRTPDALESEVVDTLISTVGKRLPKSRTTNIRRDVAIILTLYHSGLRVSELCGLDLSDINFTKREFRVDGKGCRDRIVPTTATCVKAIQDYINSDRASNTDAIFVKADGKRITRRAVSDMLVSVSRRAGVAHTTAHILRRTCATELMDRGVELELVQSLLGHQQLSTTQAYLAINSDKLKHTYDLCHPFGAKYAT